jgi:hypothetical protein
MFSSPFPILSGMPQGSTMGPHLFNMCINDLCDKICSSTFWLFARDLDVSCHKAIGDRKLLQSDVVSGHRWFIENYVKINIPKTNIISFTLESYNIHGVMLKKKTRIFILMLTTFSALDLWGLVRFVTCNLFGPDSLKLLIPSALEYVSVTWNNCIWQIPANWKIYRESWQVYAAIDLFRSIFLLITIHF